MSDWQPWNRTDRRPPVAPDQLVDVLYEGECVFDTIAADHADWFGARRAIILWRAHVVTAAAPAKERLG